MGGARLALAGCGKMGGALLAGWRSAGLVAEAHVADPAGLPPDIVADGVFETADLAALAAAPPDMLVLAVKPQIMDQVMPAARALAAAGVPALSIAAGLPLDWFQERLGAGARVLRAMPNTPAAIGRGVTVLVAGALATDGDKALAARLMAAVGTVDWVADERLMDPVTALSGGGPAYVFLLIEALADAGAAAGLAPDLAMRLARQTVIGAAALAEADDRPAETLRRNVTSPGGTTAAALDVLMAADGVPALCRDAIAAAVRRAAALGGGPAASDGGASAHG